MDLSVIRRSCDKFLQCLLIVSSPENFVAAVFVIPSNQSGHLLCFMELYWSNVGYIMSVSYRSMTSRKFPVNLIKN